MKSLHARASASLQDMGLALTASRPLLILVCAAVAFALLLAIRARRRPRYPPGPKGLPIVGNLFDIPEDEGWIRYKEYGQQYGADVMMLRPNDTANSGFCQVQTYSIFRCSRRTSSS